MVIFFFQSGHILLFIFDYISNEDHLLCVLGSDTYVAMLDLRAFT